MFEFIDILKALAAILITNSHYGSIWPISQMAFGGMLGDVLFFAVSGFCLYNIRLPFVLWYAKRIFRIYPVVWLASIISILIGYIKVDNGIQLAKTLLYPTHYHFIASIMFLYILYYFSIVYLKKLFKKIEYLIIITIVIQIILYVFFFDKSYYHIDVVEEYMCRFLFFESMLTGAFFREKMDTNQIKPPNSKFNCCLLLFFAFVLYFGFAVAFRAMTKISQFQIISPLITLILLIITMYILCFLETEKKIRLKKATKRIITHISKITLEIYITQYLVYFIIPTTVFPINFIIITISILLLATITNYIGNFCTKKLNLLIISYSKKHDK